jgi:tripartite-type tricarboxylate transporter receptor subunit TctC
VQHGDVPHDREPEPAADLCARVAGPDDAIERCKYLLALGGGNARAAVVHLQAHAAILAQHAHSNAATFGCVADRVVDQIGGELVQQHRIAVHNRGSGTVETQNQQGYDLAWPIIRGFYMGPKVSEADYHYWIDAFNKMLATSEFAKLREERGLYPFAMTGAELDTYVKKQVDDYTKLAKEFGLVK